LHHAVLIFLSEAGMSDRNDPIKLNGGVAVITGAGSGIGRALAHRLAREKMSLALADVDSAGLTETIEQLGGASASRSCHLVDVADRARVERFAAEVVERHGRVTLLMNIAGVAMHGTFEQLTLEEFDWLMKINFYGVLYGVASFLPILRKQPRAHIVNMSSIYGIIAPAGQTAYCASKFAVRGFTEALMHELDGSSVSVSCVHPGGIRTPIAKRARVSGKSDPKARDVTLAMFDVIAVMPPEKAADRIVEGVLAHEPRILVGGDAVQMDRMQRLMPVRYWDFLVRRSRKVMQKIGERRAKSAQA
jgi:NAD(P)-dependent dehydrogenase (short-subunit alcohol dehydrogenase family)